MASSNIGSVPLHDTDHSSTSGYKALVRTPAAITYKGHKVVSTVAPSSGTVLLSALNIMDGYSLTSVNDPTAAGGKRDSNNTAQILIESTKVCLVLHTL